MIDDPLDRALAAYARAPGVPADAAATRSRLLRTALAVQRRRRMRLALSILVAFLGTNATTWAWSSGRAERLWEDWASVPSSHADEGVGDRADAPASARALNPEAGNSNAPGGGRASLPSAIPIPLVPAGAPDAPHPRTREAARARGPNGQFEGELGGGSHTTQESAGPVGPLPPEYADRVAFESAHDAHFDGGTDAVALAAWDAYLARFPEGRFVPEATFNRAVCLIRLGELDTARPVLEALADGIYGSAYTADARALLAGEGAVTRE